MIMMLTMAAGIVSAPTLGVAAGQCRTPETGPAILVDVIGLKDRAGRLRLELYPDNDRDFLADDDKLVAAGKAFARVDVATPPAGPVTLCIRAPGPGRFAVALLHDRNGDHRFQAFSDGVGFGGNPKLGWSKPDAADVGVQVGTMPTRITIVANYRHGLGMRPERQP